MTAGTSTGLKITSSGVATVSKITVPVSVMPERARRTRPRRRPLQPSPSGMEEKPLVGVGIDDIVPPLICYEGCLVGEGLRVYVGGGGGGGKRAGERGLGYAWFGSCVVLCMQRIAWWDVLERDGRVVFVSF